VNKIEVICRSLNIPVIAKEVGWGFSQQDIRLLQQAGVSAIDTAGAGGTSWSQVEMYRAEDTFSSNLASSYSGWGIPTAEVIENVRQVAADLLIFASGGLRNGVDIAKCIAMGASLGGMAGPFLKAASQSFEATLELISLLKAQVNICMFATGSANIAQLRQGKIQKK
jgi:isopentenyl-diphosphate delta-isomerase